MRGFFAGLNVELASRCLRMADRQHVNYWGPTVPLALLGTVGAFAGAVRLADDRVDVLPTLLGLYLVYVVLNGSRLGAGTPQQMIVSLSPPPLPWSLFLARYLAAVFPLLLEAALILPWWWAAGGAGWLLLASVLVPTAVGLFWSTRGLRPRMAWVYSTWTLAALPGLALAGMYLEPALPRPSGLNEVLGSSPHLYLGMAACMLGTLLLTETVSRTRDREGSPMPIQTGTSGFPVHRWVCMPSAVIPLHLSWRFLRTCASQCMSWGFRPWPKLMSRETLRESWYAIGLYTCLVLSLTFSVRLLQVAARNVDEMHACEHNEKFIATALSHYRDDHGQFPSRLRDLVPSYLAAIPECPAAGTDTYSSSYRSDGKTYQFDCSGDHHSKAGCPPDRPLCDLLQGVTTAAARP